MAKMDLFGYWGNSIDSKKENWQQKEDNYFCCIDKGELDGM